MVVPVVGLEPTLPKEPHFECGTSANSITPAWAQPNCAATSIITILPGDVKENMEKKKRAGERGNHARPALVFPGNGIR